MIRVNDEARSREAGVYNSQANCQLLLSVEDTGHVTIEHRFTNLLFVFPRSFVLLFPIVLHQLCLLHRSQTV